MMHRARSLVRALLLGLTLLIAGYLVASSAAQSTLLYDAALGGTPDTQGMIYQAGNEDFSGPPLAATQVRLDGLTELRTATLIDDHAGYGITAPGIPTLNRTPGFTLTFEVQIIAETHTNPDRAGLSVLLLSADHLGIELGFWEDRIWAQADAPMFTHAEEVLIDTNARIRYELAVSGDRYTLHGGGVTLSGALRDYRASLVPVYLVPNVIFIGDNTTDAGVTAQIALIALETGAASLPSATATMTQTATAAVPTTTPSATATVTQTATAAVPTTTPSATTTSTATATESVPTATATAPTVTPTATATITPVPSATAPATAPHSDNAIMLPLLIDS